MTIFQCISDKFPFKYKHILRPFIYPQYTAILYIAISSHICIISHINNMVHSYSRLLGVSRVEDQAIEPCTVLSSACPSFKSAEVRVSNNCCVCCNNIGICKQHCSSRYGYYVKGIEAFFFITYLRRFLANFLKRFCQVCSRIIIKNS